MTQNIIYVVLSFVEITFTIFTINYLSTSVFGIRQCSFAPGDSSEQISIS